ncbi:helix-turn-helix domain-containing protein [Citromicrobium bathyomarinum]
MAGVIVNRFVERREAAGLSQSALARQIGVGQSSINRIETGETHAPRNLLALARALGTSPEYLTGETDDPDPAAGRVGPPASPSSGADDHRTLEIPVLDLAYGMGGTYLDDFDPTANLEPFPVSFIRTYSNAKAENLVMARGIGDSMAPTIGSNDQILIDRSVQNLRIADKVWAFSFGGLGMVKRLRARGDGSIAILSDNPLVPEDRAVDDELFIIGQVVGVMKKL